MRFKKNYTTVQLLIDSSGEFNIIILTYAAVLGLCFYFTYVNAQKIDKSVFLIHNILLANF